MITYIKKYIFSIIVMITIIYLSLFKPPQTSLNTFSNFDKFVHFCMYGGLSGIIWLEYLLSHKNNFKLKTILTFGLILPILFGGAMELLQKYCTEHREGDWMDFLANSIGAITASLISYFIMRPLVKKYS